MEKKLPVAGILQESGCDDNAWIFHALYCSNTACIGLHTDENS